MIRFYKNELKRLEKYEGMFRTAVYHNYAKPVLLTDMDKIERLYELKVENHTKINRGCSRCVLQFLQRVGQIYFESKKFYEKELES